MRILAAVLAVYHGANGFFMLALPRLWYATVSGVAETGPFNAHFVEDIGIAFLASAFALALFARRGADHLVVWPAALFLGGHAALHLSEMLVHGIALAAALRDMSLVVIPGLLPLALIAANNRRAEVQT